MRVLSMFEGPVESLTLRQRIVATVLFVIVILSRFFALSTSQLDWDESLFSSAVREYDVVPHHPHPPGYPLFVLAANLMRVIVSDDFRALQMVATFASFMLFPGIVMLLRELRLSARIAIAAATITAFLPTLWYYGGTALSDVPAITTAIWAAACLLRGARSPQWWISGALLCGVLAGIRPQHLLIVAVPALLSAISLRRVGVIVAGSIASLLLVVASYTGAAYFSSDPPSGYLKQVGVITTHIEDTDSFRNPTRLPLSALASKFFVTPHRGGLAGHILLALAFIGIAEGIARTRFAVILVLVMFLPIAIFSWLFMDTTAVTRYALAYVAMISILGARGAEVLGEVAERIRSGIGSILATAVTGMVTVALIAWTIPSLLEIRKESPPVESMRWLRENVAQRTGHLYLDDSLGYHAAYQLTGFRTHFFRRYEQIPAAVYREGNYCLVDRVTIQPHARLFRFDRNTLGQIARTSYFEVSLIPLESMIRFGPGWYHDEFDRQSSWRWTAKSASALLPPLKADTARLSLTFSVPLDTVDRVPTATIFIDGIKVDSVLCNLKEITRTIVVPVNRERWTLLRIDTDTVARPQERGITTDPREFGLQMFEIGWDAGATTARRRGPAAASRDITPSVQDADG